MKSFYASGLLVALGLACFSSQVMGQDFGSPSLLPIPAATANYPVTRVAANENFYQPEGVATPEASVVSPSDQHPQSAPMVSPDYHQAMQQEWGDPTMSCTDGAGGCESGMCGVGCCKNFFYAYGGALWMTREYSSGYIASLNDTTFDPALCACDSPLEWAGGFETRLGYGFNCGRNALEVTYWGLYPGSNYGYAYDPVGGAGLMSNIDFSSLDYDNGTTDQNVMDWYAGAAAHRLYTENEIHNVEINLLGQSFGGGMFGCGVCGTGMNGGSAGCNPCGPRFGSNWMLGLRIFTFNDKMAFSADVDDTTFDHDDTEVSYYNNVNNSLVGFQLGGGVSYRLFNCMTLYGQGKAGVYGNHIYAEQCVEGSNGYATVNNGVNTGSNFAVKGSKDTVAFIAQLDAGARWQFSQHFAFNAGYRVMGVSGVGITSEQIPADFQNLSAAGYINSDSSLLLHGGYAGFELCF